MSAREQAYLEFWSRFRERVLAEYPTWTSSQQSTKASWFPISAGVSGVSWTAAFLRSGLAMTLDFIHPDPEINLARLRILQAKSSEFEAAIASHLGRPVGSPPEVVWDVVEGRKSCRAAVVDVGPHDVVDLSQRDVWVDWIIATQHAMRAALDDVGGVGIFRL